MNRNVNNSNVGNEHRLFNITNNKNHLLTADKLLSKTAVNLAKAEKLTHEVPLRTENTDRLEKEN